MGTQAVSRGAYSMKTVAFAFNFLKTCPSLSRSESHCRFASTPSWAFLLRMMQQMLTVEVFRGQVYEFSIHGNFRFNCFSLHP